MEKSLLRRNFSALRRAIPPDRKAVCDHAIREALRSLPEFRTAAGVVGFVPFGAEPDLMPFVGETRFFLPRFDETCGVYTVAEITDPDRELVSGRYGIPEPHPELPAASESEKSGLLFLIPAVACDRNGVRLGRGGGWYDRLLPSVGLPRIAVIYSCQLSGEPLPCEEHDRKMDIVVTEKEILRFAAERKCGF